MRLTPVLCLIACAVPLVITGCAANRVWFTQNIRDGLSLTPHEIGQLQYYVDRRVTLQRERLSGDRSVVAGRLVTRSGRVVDEVIINPGTPGIVLQPTSPFSVAVSFEEGTSALEFGATQNGDESGANRLYCLKTANSEVTFSDQNYLVDLGDGIPCLVIDRKSLSRLEQNRRTLRGRRIAP